MTQAEQKMREAQAQARQFLKFVDDATEALFPGVKRYKDLTKDEKSTVRAFVSYLHDTNEESVN